jgi:hypothetical protein
VTSGCSDTLRIGRKLESNTVSESTFQQPSESAVRDQCNVAEGQQEERVVRHHYQIACEHVRAAHTCDGALDRRNDRFGHLGDGIHSRRVFFEQLPTRIGAVSHTCLQVCARTECATGACQYDGADCVIRCSSL